jgi:hypothetical protein
VRLREDGVSDATCSCHGCDADWVVGLDAMQAMQLLLHPPPGLAIT